MDKNNKDKTSVQEFINVKDIIDTFLYTRDNYVISYIKINPVRLELLSHNEKKSLCNILTTELSCDKDCWKFLAVSRPLDIFPLVQEYQDLKTDSEDPIQKDLLRKEIREISDYASSGEVVERQFFFMIWEQMHDGVEKDLQKRSISFANRFENSGIRAHILDKTEIIRLCNLVHNPAYITTEDMDVSPLIPTLEE